MQDSNFHVAFPHFGLKATGNYEDFDPPSYGDFDFQIDDLSLSVDVDAEEPSETWLNFNLDIEGLKLNFNSIFDPSEMAELTAEFEGMGLPELGR